MVSCIAVLSVECDAVIDAMEEIQAAHLKLRGRHGDRFRALDRRLATLFKQGATALIAEEPEYLGDGHFVFASSDAVQGILKEARHLGVI